MYKVQNQSEKKMSQLPGWLWSNSNILPPLYKRIWEAVREEKSRPGAILGEVLVDTNKIFPILLTSQLSTEVLGYIWSLANKKYAGQLTEQELYIVLALVALAQASFPFNSLEVLHLVRIPPVPNLNFTLLDTYNVIPIKKEQKAQESKVLSGFKTPGSNSDICSVSHSNFITNSNSVPSLNSSLNSSSFSNSSSILSSNSISHSNSFSSSNVLSHQRAGVRSNSVVASSSVDNLFNAKSRSDTKNSSSNCGFGVNFLLESHQSGSKNHSFNDSNDDFCEFQSAPLSTIPAIPTWDSKQGSAIGSRLANHHLGVKKQGGKLKETNVNKLQSHPTNQDKMYGIDLGGSKEIQLIDGVSQMRCGNSERLSEMFPKCSLKNQAKTVILRDTIIRNDNSPISIEISPKKYPVVDKISENESEEMNKSSGLNKLSPSKEAETAKDLMNLQQSEDKYSALRVLVEEPVVTFNKTNPELPGPLPADDFGDFVCAEQPLGITSTAEPLNIEDNLNLFSEFDFKTKSFPNSEHKSDISLVQEISDAFNALGMDEFRGQPPLENKIETQFDSDKGVQREDCLSINSIELVNNLPGVLTRSGSVPSLDLKSFLSPSQEDESTVENMHQMIYCEWKQYMESCVLLLQVAANVFASIPSEAVLREVLASAQGYNFLCNLAEVAAVCRRVNFSHKEMDINIMGFDDLLLDIDRIWAEMEPFYTNIPIITELPVWPLHQNDVTCALCLTVIMSGKVSQNENNYHAACANLWLNCVNSNLPVLRNPSVHSRSATSPSNQI